MMPLKKQGGLSIFWQMLRKSLADIRRHDPMRMAGATAFFTTFALPPIFIILFQLFSLFLSKKVVATEMMTILSNTLGRASALQIRQTTRGFGTLARNWFIASAGFVFLIFVATTLFSVIKNSLNEIWQIKVHERPGTLFKLKLRVRSLAIILVAGLLFMAAIFLDSFKILAGNYMNTIFPTGGLFFKSILDEVVSVIVISVWFIILFRYLADGRPTWKVAIAGGCLTGVLFEAGKTVLSAVMRNSNINTLYGASGAMVLILLFVFYSSFILYFGASFIKIFSEEVKDPMKLVNKAFRYQLRKIV